MRLGIIIYFCEIGEMARRENTQFLAKMHKQKQRTERGKNIQLVCKKRNAERKQLIQIQIGLNDAQYQVTNDQLHITRNNYNL